MQDFCPWFVSFLTPALTASRVKPAPFIFTCLGQREKMFSFRLLLLIFFFRYSPRRFLVYITTTREGLPHSSRVVSTLQFEPTNVQLTWAVPYFTLIDAWCSRDIFVSFFFLLCSVSLLVFLKSWVCLFQRRERADFTNQMITEEFSKELTDDLKRFINWWSIQKVL